MTGGMRILEVLQGQMWMRCTDLASESMTNYATAHDALERFVKRGLVERRLKWVPGEKGRPQPHYRWIHGPL